MNIYSKKQQWKLILLLTSVFIGVGSLWYTNKLVADLAVEENKRISIWAEATKRVFDDSQELHDLDFLLQIMEANTTIPVILTNEKFEVLAFRNIDTLRARKTGYVLSLLEEMKNDKPPIEIVIVGNKKNYCFYTDSVILKRLMVYPYVQLLIIIIFILVSYFAFSSSRKAEQNKVWVGLSRETAHQLGTPTSSLIAWIELLKEKDEILPIVVELEKDVKRLEIITERFSNIGSQPLLIPVDVSEIISRVIWYMKSRVPASVQFHFAGEGQNFIVPLNSNLFAWVIENLVKNALDASGSNGIINVSLSSDRKGILIDIKDNGKGIARKNIKSVFKPGFTTKSRGWGLGLSLARRIVEEYHNGKIFVLQSELNKGTTFRIVLPSQRNIR